MLRQISFVTALAIISLSASASVITVELPESEALLNKIIDAGAQNIDPSGGCSATFVLDNVSCDVRGGWLHGSCPDDLSDIVCTISTK